ncbi:MAG TPA: hypothetical protein VGP93_09760, partial [Polyangiaceae bacterium]|nr:hypothetical protein [Polyangiaceae bacterium]
MSPRRCCALLAGSILGLGLSPRAVAAPADSNQWAEPPERDDAPRRTEPLIPIDKRFAVGVHAGLIPPYFVVPAI